MAKANKSAVGEVAPTAEDSLIPPEDTGETLQTQSLVTPPPVVDGLADVVARVLVATEVGDKTYQPNQLVQFAAEVYAGLDKTRFDDSEAAVAYCESEGVAAVLHVQGDDGEQS